MKEFKDYNEDMQLEIACGKIFIKQKENENTK